MRLPTAGASQRMPRQPSTHRTQQLVIDGAKKENKWLNDTHQAVRGVHKTYMDIKDDEKLAAEKAENKAYRDEMRTRAESDRETREDKALEASWDKMHDDAERERIKLGKEADYALTEHNKFQTQTADGKATIQMASWDKIHQGKEYYSADEIADDIPIKRTEIVVDEKGNEVEVTRDRIPAYEVYPLMRQKQYNTTYESVAQDIGDPESRADFLYKSRVDGAVQDAKVNKVASKAQHVQIRKSQEENIDSALMRRDYKSAMEIAYNFSGTDAERQSMVKKVRYMSEYDTYNDAMSEENMTAMDNSLNRLQSDNYSGNLNEPQRLATINQLKSKMSQITAKTDTKVKREKSIFGLEVDKTLKMMENGTPVNPEEIARMGQQIDRMKQNGTLDTEAWLKREYMFNTLNQMQPRLTIFRSTDDITRARVMDDLHGKIKTWEDQFEYDIYDSVNNEVEKEIKDDPLRYAEKVGITDLATLIPMDNNIGFTPDSMQERIKSAVDVDTRYNIENTGVFTKEEVRSVVQKLNDSSDDDVLRFVSNIVGSAREESKRVWSQLAANGGGEYAILGDMVEQNELDGARMILKGKTALKETPEVVGSWNKDMFPGLIDMMGSAYSASPKTRGNVMAGIKNAYAGLSAQVHDYSGEYDEERMRKAMNMVAGNTTTIGGNTVVLPDRNMKPEVFDSFLRDLNGMYLKALGSVRGYTTPDQIGDLKGMMRDGDVRIIGAGRNSYFLYDSTKGTYLTRDSDGKPFRLKYHKNADSRTRWERGTDRLSEVF